MANEMSANELSQCATLINASISNVFKGLNDMSAQVLSIWEHQCCKTKRPSQGDLKPLLPIIRQILNSESLKFHGAGVVFAPGELEDREMHLEWWCRTQKEEIQPLTLNFNSRSDRFYDYLHMPWYTRPQQTRQPSIDGPFVDLYGTEQYIVAFSVPIFFAERFIGVAAADISLHSLEPLLVRSLMRVSNEALLLNAEGRVLAANTPSWLAGDLIRGPLSLDKEQGRVLSLIDTSSYWSVVERPVPRF
ncbi:cache domain-containing protein [Pseudomonas sp. Irchel s3h14]|jgi:Cache domain.|uniref:PDC sensor domain-containing protein n=1 Tax=Pseudomonas sp. Irchel s3h14 TaxID=2009179 RepID=UPI000BA35B76|nr:cache domain-containing protein [Pseudomonas sp. Irchel s3h14]